ncbi:MAG: PAS domain S-box protein [Desulfovibrionaceae bacterium]|nr:PAS domain S-box protein [Desulfovibrionaceae bacterium]
MAQRSQHLRPALKISLIYAALGFVWILASDWLVEVLLDGPKAITALQICKGTAFVLATSVLIFYLVRRSLAKVFSTRQALEQSETKFRDLVSDVPLAVIGYGRQRGVIYWNRACERLFGLPAAQALGKRLEELIVPPGKRAEFAAEVEEALSGTGTLPCADMDLETKDGTPLSVYASHVAHLRPDGEREIYCLAMDMTERLRSEQALRQSEALLKTTIEATNDGIWDYNLKTEEFKYSPKLAEMLGYRDGEIGNLGCFCDQNIHPEDKERFQKAFDDYLQGRADDYNMEFRLKAKDGGWKWIYTRGKIVERAPDGSPLRVIGAHTDISQIKEVQENLVQAKENAEVASKAKSEFLANISHELRTPLNGVFGMLQLLGTTAMDEEQKSFINTAMASGKSLLSVINDILDISKMEAGVMDIRDKDFDLRKTLGLVSNSFLIQATDKGLDLILDVDRAIPHLIRGDDARLRQILFNLVGNAIKFTDQGSVRITASRLSPLDDNRHRILFSVSDTGIGLSDEAQRRIFKPFTQADGSYTRKYQGAGLGLAIVKKLLALMNGSLSTDSEPGRGTTIHFALSFGKAGAEARPAVRELPAAQKASPLRILVAEDDRVNLIMTRHMLDKLGHESVFANNGEKALEL